MTLQQLSYVVKVAETGNMTVAAEQLFISQPSLSTSISTLEREMGITIFYRTNRGVTLSSDGRVFLSYARQVLEQADLLMHTFTDSPERKPHFCVSCQHYSFAVKAFVDLVKKYDAASYDFSLRETQTHEIITDVSEMVSEIGILYLSSKNSEVISKLIKKYDLTFEKLFTAKPHVFISSSHPLAEREALTLADLADYPYLSFEQGDYNSFYFSEEILSTLDRQKNIRVRDRATLFDLVIGLGGYTVSSGVINRDLNAAEIISRPLLVDEYMDIGTIRLKAASPTPYATAYMEFLREYATKRYHHPV